MAGRGRGGSRGRGRGKGMTFDVRDMGFGPGEQLPAPVLQPPPLFPPLEFHPAPISKSAEMDYMIALKKDYVLFLKDHLALKENGEVMNDINLPMIWKIIPDELKTNKKRKADDNATKLAKKSNFDLNALDALEQLENKKPKEEKEEEDEENQEGEDENEDEMETDADEEMDDGTDYVNNYFDNGEGFDDDDDAGNDGPIY